MKRAFIGPFQSGFLDELVETSSPDERVQISLRSVLYIALLQSGATEIQVISTSSPKVADIVRRRLKHAAHGKQWFEISKYITHVFKNAVPTFENPANQQLVRHLEHFITDLIFSARAGSNLVWLSRVPSLSAYENTLPPQLLFPIQNLMGQLRPIVAATATLASELRRADVLLIDEILRSELFTKYARDHTHLSDSTLSLEERLMKLDNSTSALVAASGGLLRHSRTAALVIEASARAMDIFGKVPSAFAGFIGAVMKEWLDARAKVVVYDLHETVDSVFLSKLDMPT